MPPSQCYKYILTVCDFFTKWSELTVIQDKKATTIARELYMLFMRYGCPDVIISDRGTEFCNAVSEAIFTYMRVEHRVSAPYHPQTNGKKKHLIACGIIYRIIVYSELNQMICAIFFDNLIFFIVGMVEKLNSTIISALKACTTTPTDWVDCLQSVAMSIRSQPHESTGISPYEMMFGTPMRLQTELEDSDIPSSASKEQMAQIFPQPLEGEESAKIFESVDKILQIIHNSASGKVHFRCRPSCRFSSSP